MAFGVSSTVSSFPNDLPCGCYTFLRCVWRVWVLSKCAMCETQPERIFIPWYLNRKQMIQRHVASLWSGLFCLPLSWDAWAEHGQAQTTWLESHLWITLAPGFFICLAHLQLVYITFGKGCPWLTNQGLSTQARKKNHKRQPQPIFATSGHQTHCSTCEVRPDVKRALSASTGNAPSFW